MVPLFPLRDGARPLPSIGQVAEENRAPENTSDPALDARDRILCPGDAERVKPLARKLAANIFFESIKKSGPARFGLTRVMRLRYAHLR